MIEVSNLCFDYPEKRALRDVNFSVAKGAIVALVGPNGAGKTTLLRCLAALADPFSGAVQIDGLDTIASPREVHQKIGYLPDTFGLYTDLLVWQCLHFAALQHQLSGAQASDAVTIMAAKLGLTPYLNHPAGTLSRGWRQKVGIAQAMIHAPALLLLDEPAAGLDPEARHDLSLIFRRLKEEGTTLVVSSHILAELEDYCTDMLILREGEIVSHSAPSAAPIEAQGQIQICHIQFIGSPQDYIPLIEAYEGVEKVTQDGERIQITLHVPPAEPSYLLKGLVERGAHIAEFKFHTPSLQEIYLSSSSPKKEL